MVNTSPESLAGQAAANAAQFAWKTDDVFGRIAGRYDFLCDVFSFGIREFVTAETLAEELRAAGFTDVSFERLSLGIVAIHTARKP